MSFKGLDDFFASDKLSPNGAMKPLYKSAFVGIIIVMLMMTSSFAEVRVDLPDRITGAGWIINGPKANVYNTTTKAWELAGWRTKRPNFLWQGTTFSQSRTFMNNGEFETRVDDNLLRKIPITGNTPKVLNIYNQGNPAAGVDASLYDPYVLLKTGSDALVNDPIDELPITLKQLDSLMKTPNFYNENYRYKDDLGTHGGDYSGGFRDTYLGQTQVQIAIPTNNFSVNMTDVNLDVSKTNGPMYWMSMAMGQEYLNVDHQWMLAIGAKETFAGLNGTNVKYLGENTDGAYGCFEVEAFTMVSRAIGYPQFFPEFSTELSNSVNATTFPQVSGMSCAQFAAHYMGAKETKINSAEVVNALFSSAMVWFYNYDICALAKDLCFKEVLRDCIDPYVGIAAMVPLYNLGINSGADAPLHVSTYQTLLNDPMARNRFITGNGNYWPQVIGVVEALVKASDDAQSNNGVKIIDMPIDIDDVEKFFFGEGGNVTTQGKGGLARHFVVDRDRLWTTAKAAFDMLKGKAPSMQSNPDKISFRYDFVPLLRVLKDQFLFKRIPPKDAETTDWVNKKSKVGGCKEDTNDGTFPFMSVENIQFPGDFIVTVEVTDDRNVQDAQWTIDRQWKQFKKGKFLSGDAKKQKYELTVTKKEIADVLGGAAGTMWIMATDSAGNSIVKSIPIEGQTVLDSAVALDSKGDGMADQIELFIVPGDSAMDLTKWDEFKYSWPSQSLSETANTGQVTVSSVGILLSDPNLTDGAGLGKVKLRYDTTNLDTDVLDKVGPAIDPDGAVYYEKEGGDSSDDTLRVTFTENVDFKISKDKEYLWFKKGNGSPKKVASKNVDKQSDSEFNFVFSNKEMDKYDSVKIIHTSGIRDEKKNRPLEKNQWVEIKKIGTKEPRFSKAYLKDKDGDGYGDVVTVHIKTGSADDADKADDIDKYEYSWPTKGSLTAVSKGDLTIDNNKNTIVYEKNGIKPGVGEGKIKMKYPSTTISGSLIDSVGPAIKTALLYEKENSGDDDSLFITFTEPIKNVLKDNVKYIRVNGSSQTSKKALKQDDKSTVYLFTFSSGTIKDGDDVNLVTNTGIVDTIFDGDKKRNPPADNNKEAKVETLAGKYRVVSGGYYDRNADGIMDEVRMTFSKEVEKDDLDDMDFTIHWPKSGSGTEKITFDGKDLKTTGDKKVMFYTVEKKYSPREFTTSIDKAIHKAEVKQPDPKNDGKSVTTAFTDAMEDKMAPVVKVASYLDYAVPDGDKMDRLTVQFSEEVKDQYSNEPFDLTTGSKTYSVELDNKQHGGNSVAFTVDEEKNKDLPEEGDSLWIDVKGKITDIAGNEQQNSKNIRAKINFTYIYSFSVIAYPNGIKGEKSSIEKAAKYYNTDKVTSDKDIVILVKPHGIVKNPESFTMRLTVFDAVGNVVLRDIPMKYNKLDTDKKRQAWSFVWEKRMNSGSRIAGAGSYLSVVHIETKGGSREEAKTYEPVYTMIGIAQ